MTDEVRSWTGWPATCPPRRRGDRGVRPGPPRGLVRDAVRHHRRADRRPAGDLRPAGVVPGAGGQDARRRDLGARRGGAGGVPRRRPTTTPPRRGHRRAGRPLGAVWSGDARDGFNGGGNYVRWIATTTTGRAAGFFGPRCDRVRVMPFLDGVPCSIHGFVLPDGTAVFRPVEIVTLRDAARRQFVYGGLGTYWDPPAADREEMREAARRVGDHLRRARLPRRVRHRRGAHRGRLPAHRAQHPDVRRRDRGQRGRPAVLHPPPGRARGGRRHRPHRRRRRVAGAGDGRRAGRQGGRVRRGRRRSADETYPVSWDGTLDGARRASRPATSSPVGATPNGLLRQGRPVRGLVPGQRLAPVNAALLAFLDRDVRRRLRRRSSPQPTYGAGACPWRGSWWSVAGSAAWPRPPGWPSSATRSPCWSGSARWAARSRRSPTTASTGTRARPRRWCPP